MTMVANSGGYGGVKCFPVGWHAPAKACDSCKTAVALLFCNKDSVFLCLACDVKMHIHTCHGRVWMCEACEQAPASVTCKADAAALCVTCDRDIHSANPLSRRHDRIPVVPFYDCAELLEKSCSRTFREPNSGNSGNSGSGNEDLKSTVTNDDEIEWGIPTDSIDANFPCDTSPVDIKSIEMLFPESAHLSGFDFPAQFHDSVNDCLVPFQKVETVPTSEQFPLPKFEESFSSENRYEIDFTLSNINCYNKNSYLSKSISHSVSSSSIDVGIVPESNSMSEISHPFVVHGGCGAPNSQQPTQLTGVDREARVMRYREKKKNRKFEKTIRYASRKAYAETRPRIKGRFAKRIESVESDVDRWLGVSSTNSYGLEVEYGVVPSYRRGL